MLFKFAWTHSQEARDKTIKQFMETGGMPPEGATMLSRYHNVDGTGGFAIVESSDAAALADYALDWNGLIKIDITPNAQLAEMAQNLFSMLSAGKIKASVNQRYDLADTAEAFRALTGRKTTGVTLIETGL